MDYLADTVTVIRHFPEEGRIGRKARTNKRNPVNPVNPV
jgi:hypothetical protein